MVDPDSIGQAIGGAFDAALFTSIVKWTGYIFGATAIIAVIVIVYFIIQYKYKVTYPLLHFNESKTAAQIIGYKTDRARDVKKGGIKKQHLFFKRKLIEPFKEEHIDPKNKVNILKVNDDGTYVPMPKISFSNEIEDFQQLSPEEKYWAVLQLKENANTYQDVDAQKRLLIMTMVTVILCLVCAAITVWICLQAPGKIASSLDRIAPTLAEVAKNLGPAPN